MKAKSDPAIGITKLYVKMCKLSIWAMQTEYIKVNWEEPVQEKEDEPDAEDGEEEDNNEIAPKPEKQKRPRRVDPEDEEDETGFEYVTCGLNEYVKGLGFEYQDSLLGLEPQYLTDVAIQCGQFKGKMTNSEW